ncbi:muts domain V-domain-containing protein [Mrakia frigida]|uniref:mismatch repair ATPase MSH6 n=1 Tax=Mrakia frigida TaxID=29902 RepID=UPI003FCC135D
MAKAAPPSSSASKKQSTLLGFFSKQPGPASSSPSAPKSSSSKPAPAPPSSSSKPLSSKPSTSLALNSSPLATFSKKPLPKPKQIDVDEEVVVDEDSEGDVVLDSQPPKVVARAGTSSSVSSSLPKTSAAQSEATFDEDAHMDEGEEFPVLSARVKRRIVTIDSDEDEEDVFTSKKTLSKKAAPPKKQARHDSEDEYDNADDDDLFASAAAEYDEPMDESDASEKPVKKAAPKLKKPAASRPSIRPSGAGSSSKGSNSTSFLTKAELKRQDDKETKKAGEDCFDFLKDPRDKDGNKPDSPDYDPRTLYIPKKAWDSFTPFETQFWEIKQNHFDTVLFFQKGKFAELYENDAEIGNREFGLKLTDRVKMKMVGVPEQSFDMWAAKFLGAGYKVGRVDQTETALGAEMRQKSAKAGGLGKKTTAGREIVHRELKHVLTNGTVSDAAFLSGDEASHCVSIKEENESPHLPSSFGITVLDAATGAFSLSTFDDDVCRTKLETMFRQLRPKEIVYEKGNLSVPTMRALRSMLPSSCVWVPIKSFGAPQDTLDALAEFFPSPADAIVVDGVDGDLSRYPEAIRSSMDQPLVLSSLGGIISYLKQLNLDQDLLSQKNFDIYDPIRQGQNLVLDGQTLAHIEVLVNNEGGEEGSLLKILQRCTTPFGKRLFRLWLCMPLRKAQAINDRLDAVEEIMQHPNFEDVFRKLCKGLPDLERQVSRIHAKSIKISDFMKVINSFDDVHRGFEKLADIAESFESKSIGALLKSAPDLTSYLENIRSLFKYDKEEGTLLPVRGADEDYETIMQEIKEVEEELETLREGYVQELRTKNVEYWHSAQGQKEIYQIQVPASTKVPKSWSKTSGTKAVSRYTSPEILPLIRTLQEARETRTGTVKTFIKRLFSEFDNDRVVWLKAVKTLAELDCLASLALASGDLDEPKCRPVFVESEHARVDFKDLRHPAMCLRSDFIPNDVEMGGEKSRMVLLTGPNMAGKSTLLRMTAAGIILAQLGMYVPASSATLSPLDKIQTRMGAYDNMFASSSTFKVELDECSKILREAGPKSLVILDELGRGTSTHDGLAIAAAVLHHLATHTLPLGFFATHYASLSDDFAYHANIRSMHMSTKVDNEKREVTFLYKLIEGNAESSHGTHVAHLAGVPLAVVTRAEEVSKTFFLELQTKLARQRMSSLPLVAHADFAFLFKLGTSSVESGIGKPGVGLGAETGSEVLRLMRESVGRYERNEEGAAVVVEGEE